ncbi:MAG TPA: hypothetical protein VJ300_05095 [Thermoplasmata archaeon]|nr:hypothetical protein [Thermoplasmata archaeon]
MDLDDVRNRLHLFRDLGFAVPGSALVPGTFDKRTYFLPKDIDGRRAAPR